MLLTDVHKTLPCLILTRDPHSMRAVVVGSVPVTLSSPLSIIRQLIITMTTQQFQPQPISSASRDDTESPQQQSEDDVHVTTFSTTEDPFVYWMSDRWGAAEQNEQEEDNERLVVPNFRFMVRGRLIPIGSETTYNLMQCALFACSCKY